MPNTQNTSWVAIAGLIGVLVLVLGAAAYLTQLAPLMEEERVVRSLEMQSESTEPEVIEADLTAESPDEFGTELDKAFAELDASLGQ